MAFHRGFQYLDNLFSLGNRLASTLLPQLPLHLPKPHNECIQDAEHTRHPQAVPEDVAGMLMRGEGDLSAGKQIQILRFLPCGQPK